MRKLLFIIAFIALTVGANAQGVTIFTEFPYITIQDWAKIGGIITLESGNTISNLSIDDITYTGRFGSSYYQFLTDIATMDRQHIISGTAKMTGDDPFNTKTQMQGGFFGIQLGEGLAISEERKLYGSENKATLDRDMSNVASFIIGSFDKVSIRKTTVFAGTAVANMTLLGRDNTATIAQGYNYYAEKSAAGFTASSILGTAANTWDYGLDLSNSTLSTADFKLQNGTLFKNSSADLLTITEATVDIDGASTASSYTSDGTITATDSLLMADVAYDATTWNGSFGAASKNALRDKIETMGGSTDSTFNNIIAYDTLTIGYAVPNETLPVFEMKGDADDDAEDVTEVFTITLDPNIDPTKSQWVITSTQGAGYNFDKDIYFAAGAAEISAISDFTVVSDNDLILQGDELNFNQQSDVATGSPFDFDQNKTEYELTGSSEQAVMSIQGNINKSSGDYIGILLDVLETAITGSNDELMALRTGGVDKFTISNTGVVGLLNGAILDNTETDTLEITETVVKISGDSYVTGSQTAYGSMYQADAANAIATTTQNLWVIVDGFTGDNENDCTFAADTILISRTAVYEITVTASFSGDAGDIFECAIAVNGAVDATHKFERKTANNDTGSASIVGTYSLTANDGISLWLRNTDATPGACTIEQCNVVVRKL